VKIRQEKSEMVANDERAEPLGFHSVAEIEREAAKIINSTWHYSWHWERGQWGRLTLKGWEQALQDGEDLLLSAQNRVTNLERFLPKVRAVIRQEKSEADNAE